MTELRITITVPLPDDLFEQAKAIADLNPALNDFRHALPDGAFVQHELGTSKTPRKPRSDAGKARGAKPNGEVVEKVVPGKPA